jgi:hypothetical protein
MFWIVVLVFLGSAGTAAAQSGLSVGYQPLHIPDKWIVKGFNVDVAAAATDTWAIVGEFGMVHHAASSTDPVRSNLFHFGGGPRLSFAGGRAVPFVQALAGAEVTSAKIPTPTGTREDSDGVFMLQPGVGVYVPFNERCGFVAQTDLRLAFFSEETDKQYRIVLGARFPLR